MPTFTNLQATLPRIPCPDGTSIGTGEWNGTLFLICSEVFNDSASAHPSDVALGFGLGLGLGIPCLTLLCFLGCRYGHLFGKKMEEIQYPKKTIVPTILHTETELSEKAYSDFCFDMLTDQLKHELMVLRVRKGRNLDELVQLAQRRNAFEVATWISRMNPGEFPREVQKEAHQPQSVLVEN